MLRTFSSCVQMAEKQLLHACSFVQSWWPCCRSMNLTLWDTRLRDGNGHTKEAQNMFYAKINFAITRHVLMQTKLTTNATKVMQVLSGKLWNLTKTEQMIISSKHRKTCITKRWILCSSSNVIYRLLCCCLVIVIVTVIPTKCLHLLVTVWQLLLLVL
jgi:hypothetical protein